MTTNDQIHQDSNNYVNFCSFGTLCYSSTFLKRHKLKKESYPFDWVFSTPKIIIDCLETDFKYFLDKRYYTQDTTTFNNTNIYYYKSGLTMFNHHNPKREKDYEYYKRCIDRFYKMLASPEKKLFIITFIDKESYINLYFENKVNRVYDTTKEDIIEFNEKLKKYTSNYTLLCIFQKKSDNIKHTFTSYDNIDFLDYESKSFTYGIHFLDEDDNTYISEIIKNRYKL